MCDPLNPNVQVVWVPALTSQSGALRLHTFGGRGLEGCNMRKHRWHACASMVRAIETVECHCNRSVSHLRFCLLWLLWSRLSRCRGWRRWNLRVLRFLRAVVCDLNSWSRFWVLAVGLLMGGAKTCPRSRQVSSDASCLPEILSCPGWLAEPPSGKKASSVQLLAWCFSAA